MKDKQPILSLCIPTYNRAEILRGNLAQLQKQLSDIDLNELELIVSNNCSPDNTDDVIRSFIDQGMPIIYNCNDENLGADGNFLKCMHIAKGKYIYLLGDDDYLKDGSIAYLLDSLRGKDYGLLYIDFQHPNTFKQKEYNDVNVFLRTIGRQLTYMSANIFRKDIVDKVNASKYENTCLLQMPFFITSSLSKSTNAIICREILMRDMGNTAPPQKYDFLEVFSKNYVVLTSDLLRTFPVVKTSTIEYLKKDMFMTYTGSHVFNYLINPFKTHDRKRWQYVWPYYKHEWYFYWNVVRCVCLVIKGKLAKMYGAR